MARRLSPHTWLALATACVFPTDRSADVSVEFVTASALLVARDTLDLEARVVDAGGIQVQSAEVAFISDDPTVGIVDQSGKFRAHVLPIALRRLGFGEWSILGSQIEDRPDLHLSARRYRCSTLWLVFRMFSVSGFGLCFTRFWIGFLVFKYSVVRFVWCLLCVRKFLVVLQGAFGRPEW